MKTFRVLSSATALVAIVALPMRAQIAITPMVGGYIPASDVNQVTGSAQGIAKTGPSLTRKRWRLMSFAVFVI